MENYTLEVCVDSVESAAAAYRGGANRLELCQNLIIGGTTPDLELYRMVREQTDLTIHALIRPRFGDFLYTQWEYDLMRREIAALVKAGADGVVIGSLCADGSLNVRQMKGMIEAAEGRRITLHRAFDVCADPYETLEAAKELGVDIILTSGQEKDCYTGRKLIAGLVKAAGDDICILAGGGVNADVIAAMQKETGLSAFHMSGKETLDSGMVFRNPRVSMGLPGISEFEVWRTSEAAVAKASEVLRRL